MNVIQQNILHQAVLIERLKKQMTVHITLVTGKADSRTDSMLVESLSKRILDSARTKTYQVRNG